MKKAVKIILFSSIFLLLTGCSGKDAVNETDSQKFNNTSEEQVTNDKEEEDLQELSKTLALQIVEGEFKDTVDRFALFMKMQVSEKALKEAWDTTIAGMGKFIEIYEVKEETQEKYQIVSVILKYENSGIKINFTYNKTQKLEGLWFKYALIESEAVSTDEFEEIKITFGEGEYPVSGILTLPKGIDQPPVAILVPGSGNHNVEEAVGANKPFQDIAYGLARKGIASIRYNERVFLYPELAVENFTIQMDSLNDASDAIAYAANSDKINKDKIIIIGHSLGGMMAPQIAYDHSDVKGIIILAGSPRNLEDIILDQVKDAVNNSKEATTKQIEETIKMTEAGVEAVNNLTKASNEVLLGYPASYWYSLNQINIAKTASELTIPIFIAQGKEDFQVYADIDYMEWQKLLGDKSNVTFRLYDNLNHLFMTFNGKKDVTEYNIKGIVDQTVIDEMAAWIKQ